MYVCMCICMYACMGVSNVNLPVKYFSVKNPDFLKNGKIWKVN